MCNGTCSWWRAHRSGGRQSLAVWISDILIPAKATGLGCVPYFNYMEELSSHLSRALWRKPRRGLFNFLQDSPVPKNPCVWTLAEKLSTAFSPDLGLAPLMHEVEIIRYERISFVNAMRIIMEDINKGTTRITSKCAPELFSTSPANSSTRWSCATMGETCCMCISENDADGYLNYNGIKNITLLTGTWISKNFELGID